MRPPSASFVVVFEGAIAGRGLRYSQVAEALGVTRQRLVAWRDGNLPTLAKAVVLAELLGEPRLASIVREARSKQCPSCHGAFIAENRKKVYCTPTCGTASRILRGSLERIPVGKVQTRLAMFESSVFAMCGSCEPEGVCRTSSCELRVVSPLPLALGVPDAIPARRWGWEATGVRRLDMSVRTKALWADPEWRAVQLTRIAEGKAKKEVAA